MKRAFDQTAALEPNPYKEGRTCPPSSQKDI